MQPKRRIVMFNRVSADGYFASADGKLDWTVPEPDLDRSAADSIGGFDTILFGRRTYQMFEAFWPHVLDDSPTAPDPHQAGRRSPELRAMAVMLNESEKVVFSKTLRNVTWMHSRLVPELDPHEVEAMKQQSGKDLIVFGSGAIVAQLTRHGLIDEYQFVVAPVLLGDGKPLITGLPKSLKLELLQATPYAAGNVKLRYACRR